MSITKKVDIAGNVDSHARLSDEGNTAAVCATLNARNPVEPNRYARNALNIRNGEPPIDSRVNARANAPPRQCIVGAGGCDADVKEGCYIFDSHDI